MVQARITEIAADDERLMHDTLALAAVLEGSSWGIRGIRRTNSLRWRSRPSGWRRPGKGVSWSLTLPATTRTCHNVRSTTNGMRLACTITAQEQLYSRPNVTY